jgi:hypothetical protein
VELQWNQHAFSCQHSLQLLQLGAAGFNYGNSMLKECPFADPLMKHYWGADPAFRAFWETNEWPLSQRVNVHVVSSINLIGCPFHGDDKMDADGHSVIRICQECPSKLANQKVFQCTHPEWSSEVTIKDCAECARGRGKSIFDGNAK